MDGKKDKGEGFGVGTLVLVGFLALAGGIAIGHYGGEWLASAEAEAKKLAGGQ